MTKKKWDYKYKQKTKTKKEQKKNHIRNNLVKFTIKKISELFLEVEDGLAKYSTKREIPIIKWYL